MTVSNHSQNSSYDYDQNKLLEGKKLGGCVKL